ncbi:MAG TPA: heparinase II/III family protein [Herpetosiphonaceae bacterium]|nr:heparinase II/III family protein [Herpetosiphonaceae bacterium]
MRLFLPDELARAGERADAEPWAAGVLQAVQARTDAWLRAPGDIPKQAGGWLHDFVCPEHWDALIFDPASPRVHRCRHGEIRSDERIDAAWHAVYHRFVAAQARDLALVAAVAGDTAAAAAARRILLDYARRYAEYAGDREARPWMLAGRAFNQALTEALWAVPLAQSYDLLRPTLSSDDARMIDQGLLRPVAATLAAAQDDLVGRQGKLRSNYNAWLLTALGCLGYALDDSPLVDRAIDGPAGFKRHLAVAILPDGFEYEGSPYYHTFVALAYTILAESSRANGRDLYIERGPAGQSIEATWHAVASLAWPDGSIPQANDGAYWGGGPFDAEIGEIYEVALARTGAAEYAWLLDRAYVRRGHGRDQWTALLFGERDIRRAPMPERPSVCLPSVGYAVLRHASNQTAPAVGVGFGPYAGSHSHLDRLAPQIWPWSRDPGTPPYGVEPRRDWYQRTAAHNAVVVDGQSQAQAGARLLRWRPTRDGGTIWLAGDDLYSGVRLSRFVSLAHGSLADLTTLASGDEHIYDWLLHGDRLEVLAGAELTEASGELSTEDAYRFLSCSSTGTCAARLELAAGYGEQQVCVALAADRPFEVILAHGPGLAHDPARRRMVLIARVRARHVQFLMTSDVADE